MLRRIFTICLVLGFLAFALVFLTAKPVKIAHAQALTPTKTNTMPCGSVVVVTSTPTPTFTPTPRTPTATTTPNCGFIYITATPGAPIITPTPTITPTAAPILSGHVRVGSSSGAGLANVNVCYYLASYTFDCATHTVLTDANGYYQMSICVPQQETVTIQASLAGYSFSPASYVSILYSGCKTGTYDFVATTGPTPTRTPTSLTPTRTRTPTTGPSLTPTRTRTVTPYSTACDFPGACITGTPATATRTPTFTATTGPNLCTPTSTITAPFTFDGAGTLCWQSNSLGLYINSWNTTKVTLNFTDITNLYVPASSYPSQIGGYWYISYTSAAAYGHFETK